MLPVYPSTISLISLIGIISLFRGATPGLVRNLPEWPFTKIIEDEKFSFPETETDQNFPYQSWYRAWVYRVATRKEKNPADFSKAYDYSNQVRRAKMIQAAFAHLMVKKIPQRELNGWIEMFTTKSKNHQGRVDCLILHRNLAYGFYNLALKHAANQELKSSLISGLDQVKENFPVQIMEDTSVLNVAWVKELWEPHTGLSKTMSNLEGLREISIDEPLLHRYIDQHSKNQGNVQSDFFDLLNKIFRETQNYSGQTRILAIAFLYHLRRSEVTSKAAWKARGFLLREDSLFFLKHERELLKAIKFDVPKKVGVNLVQRLAAANSFQERVRKGKQKVSSR